MWSKEHRTLGLYLVIGVLVIVAGFGVWHLATRVITPLRQEAALVPCTKETNDSLIIECIFRALEPELKHYGVSVAAEMFARAYREFPAFVKSACHVQAHRLGDMTYYQVYRGTGDMDAIDFPQSTTACGYGFFHGFLEHLIQDNPDPAFVTTTCDYLVSRLGKEMGDIELTCYHGSGHGFMLAQSERVQKQQWGSVKDFTTTPLTQCESLGHANKADIEQCKEGVFNVLNEWMVLGQYGFHFDTAYPFALCATVPGASLKACYYEMAQKIDGIAHEDPEQIAKIAKEEPPEYIPLIFSVGVAGAVQNVIAIDGGYQKLLASCAKVGSVLYEACLGSVINGLYEHGEPQEEYKKALVACTDTSVSEDQKDYCYSLVIGRLSRFYTPERIPEICKDFPTAYQAKCSMLTRP